MRPFATLGFLLALTACSSGGSTVGSFVGNPADGWFDFIGDTVSFRSNPNRPVPESDTIRRAMGQDVQTEPLLSETGNIWPTMPRREPTMLELERAPPAGPTATAPIAAAPDATRPAPVPPAPAPPAPVRRAVGSSTPPTPVTLPPPQPVAMPAQVSAPSINQSNPTASGTALPTPAGTAIVTTGQNGIMSYTLPSGVSGRAINNGNGTMTLIGADGQVMSVPAPR